MNKIRDKVEGMVYPSLEDFAALKQRMEKVESAAAALKKSYGDLEQQMKKLKQPESGANQDQVDRLTDDLARLRTEFEQHREFSTKNINDLNLEMPHKADR